MFLRKKCRRLLLPYLIWGVFSVVLYLLTQKVFLAEVSGQGHYANMGGEVWWQPFVSLLHAGGWPAGEGFRANSVLWFLPCMFTVQSIYWVVDRFVPSRRCQILFSLLFCVLGWLLSEMGVGNLPWGMGLACWYICFLIWGRWFIAPISAHLQDKMLPRSPVAAKVCLSLATCAFVLICWHTPSLWFLHNNLAWRLAFFSLGLGGACLTMVWAREFSGILWSRIGIASLSLMLLHKFPLIFMQNHIPFVREVIATGGMWGIACLFGCVIVVVFGCYLAHCLLARVLPLAVGMSAQRR